LAIDDIGKPFDTILLILIGAGFFHGLVYSGTHFFIHFVVDSSQPFIGSRQGSRDHLSFHPTTDGSYQHGQLSDSQSSETAAKQLCLPLL